MMLSAIMPVRNEDWILGLSARAALMWCDHLVLLLHACTDRSLDIAWHLVREYEGRVKLRMDNSPLWDEMRHRQEALEVARCSGATHIAIVDADEILTGNILGEIREKIESAHRDAIVMLPGYNLRGCVGKYHSNGIWGDRWFASAFADDPRLHWSGDRFHHRKPMGMAQNPLRIYSQGAGGIMHLWGVSERRLKAKHALYKVTETLRWPSKNKAEIDRQYNLAFEPGADHRYAQWWDYSPVPTAWWEPYRHLMTHLDINAALWQEAECRRLVAEHGVARFAGLNLFGVCDSPVLSAVS